MPQFKYKVRDGHGELATGVVQAHSVEEAGNILRNEGKFIVKLDEVRAGSARSEQQTARNFTGGGKRIKREDVITFAHQLAVMIDTGVPISDALECVADQSANESFKTVLRDVTEQVQAGGELSAAMQNYPKVFPPVMISLIRASEVSGTMGPMLDRISNYLSKEHQTAKKIRGALTYPAVMMFMAIGVTVFLLVFVLPQFKSIYSTKGAALPGPTQLLMTLSEGIINYWYFWLFGIIGGILGLVVFSHTQAGRQVFDYIKINTPVLGPLFTKLYVTRSTRTMGTMIRAGVPVLDMVAIVRMVTNNIYYEHLWDEVDDRLRQGSQLSNALFTSPLIPRPVAQMIFAGEKAGRLGPVMEKIANYTEIEFDEQVKQTTQFIEPAMVTFMGGLIGFVAIALLLPIFSVGTVVAS